MTQKPLRVLLTCVNNGFGNQFEHQSFLWINVLNRVVGNTEELIVKLFDGRTLEFSISWREVKETWSFKTNAVCDQSFIIQVVKTHPFSIDWHQP